MRKTRNILAIVSIPLGGLILYNYQKGVINYDESLLWLSILLAVLSAANLIFAIYTGETFASGAIISKLEHRGLYKIAILVNIFILLLCLFGVWKYS
ncbi:hypothetical protein [Zooshikella ganghwensis]|uniref:Uncharacterized protein n=1 Tax=Zooshikella ganghwensis TaxID=202772 RepID=A0A4P9VHD5_9GAMM|nr:hypothetical protein [Zooshikella ganghwensis]RDH41630.1 hypothetical protein B9G39_27595 [Zooshikella ganghwensis]